MPELQLQVLGRWRNGPKRQAPGMTCKIKHSEVISSFTLVPAFAWLYLPYIRSTLHQRALRMGSLYSLLPSQLFG